MFSSRARRSAWTVLTALVFLAVGGALLAQTTGNIFGHVEDEQQGRLPGVTVSLTGPTRPRRRRRTRAGSTGSSGSLPVTTP